MPHIRANGIGQFHLREGEPGRPVLVLAHPVGFDHRLWDSIVPLLTPHWQVLRYDLRGHGLTEATPGDYEVCMLAADAMSLISSLGIERFAFCGVSLGGLVGLWLGAHDAKGLTHLVVSNLSARLQLPREEWDRRIALARGSGLSGFAEGVRERMFSAAYRASGAPLLTTLIDDFLAMDPDAYSSALAALRDADLTPLLNYVKVPTLVVGGEEDAAVPRDHLEFIAKAVPGAQLRMLPGGHLSPVEAPVQLSNELTQFLMSPVDSSRPLKDERR